MNSRAFLKIGIGVLATAGIAVLFAGGRNEPQLPRVSVPNGGIGPEIVVHSKVLDLVYGRKGGEIFFARSGDEGATISTPVQINTKTNRAVVGGERGPKLAIGRDGIIHVAWMGPVGQFGLFYSRSTDGGKSFSAPRNLAPDGMGVDGVSIATDEKGQVFVLCLGGGPAPGSPASSYINLAYSNDDGATFAPLRRLRSNYPGGACACCNLKALMAPDGRLMVGFRGAHRSIRDIYLLRGRDGSEEFEASLVSSDNWKIDGCPMQGPFVEVTPKGEISVAWTSKEQVYRSFSQDGGRTFARRIAPAETLDGVRRDPLTLANSRGEVFFAWLEKRDICWERIGPDGTLLASGRNSRLPESSRPAAFVTSDVQFRLVF